MRSMHGWHVALLSAAVVFAQPVDAAPRHVVSASLCTDEYVFRLLPRARIAALSFLSADRHPVVSTIADAVKGIPLVHASAEEILSYTPDAVVLYAGTETRLHAQLHDAGAPVIDVPWANSLADIRRVTLALGDTLGAQGRARALLARMDRMLSSGAVPPPRVRTLVYEPNGYATADGVTDEILNAAGLADSANEIGSTRSGTIPIEAVVADPPELLLLNGANEVHPARADLVLRHPALASLASRILVAHISLTPLLCPGPWSADAVPVLAEKGRAARALAQSQGQP
jgi:iron complex transport system substrate-binding protein